MNQKTRSDERRNAIIAFALIGSALTFLVPYALVTTPAVSPIPVEIQRGVAVHESAHAVVALVLNQDYPLDGIKVLTENRFGDARRGGTSYSGEPDTSTAQARFNEAVIRMAGASAERIILGREPQGDLDDLWKAQDFCRPAPRKTGRFYPTDLLTDADGNPRKSRYEMCLTDAQNKAEAIVKANADRIKDLADTIINSAPQNGYRWVSISTIRDCLARNQR